MSIKPAKTALLLTFAVLAQLPTLAQAELYKWVDAAGRTHYSDNKADAPQGGARELKVAAAPAPPSGMPDWKRQEEDFKKRQAAAKLKARHDALFDAQYQSRRTNTGVTPESDLTRCQLARDVVSGAVEHPNGALTDSKDIQVARRDIAKFCK